MKKILMALGILLCPTIASADYLGVLTNSTTRDTVAIPFNILDSLGSPTILADGDSVYTVFYSPNGTQVFADSMAFDDASIKSYGWEDFAGRQYVYAEQIENMTGTGEDPGLYTVFIVVQDLTGADLVTTTMHTFYLYETARYDIALDSSNQLDFANDISGLNVSGGIVEANLEEIENDNQSSVDLKDFVDAGYDPTFNVVRSDLNFILGATSALNNLEDDYDGTGFAKANSTIGTATAVTNDVTLTDAEHGLISDSTWLKDSTGFYTSPQMAFVASQTSAGGLDSAILSRNLHRIVWGTVQATGSDSSTLAERDGTVAAVEPGAYDSTAWSDSTFTGPDFATNFYEEFATEEELVDAMWDEDSAGHYTSPQMAFVASQTGASAGISDADMASIADTLLNRDTSDVQVAGSIGEFIMDSSGQVSSGDTAIGGDERDVAIAAIRDSLQFLITSSGDTAIGGDERDVAIDAMRDSLQFLITSSGDTAIGGDERDLVINGLHDTLIYMGGQGLGIYIDSAAGNTNTVIGVDGTNKNPVSTLVAARTLSNALGIKRYYFINRSTFNDASNDFAAMHQNFHMIGIGHQNAFAFGGQQFTGSHIQNMDVSGLLHASGEHVLYTDVTFGHITGNFAGHAYRSILTDTIVIKTGQSLELINCASGVAGNMTPTIDFSSGASSAGIRGYSGGIRIMNGASNDTVSIETDGQVVISANNTSLTATIRGMLTLTDSGTTTSLTKDAVFSRQESNLWVPGPVWNQLADSTFAAGTMGDSAKGWGATAASGGVSNAEMAAIGDTVWQKIFDITPVTGSYGDSATGWGATSASSLDSQVVSNIVHRVVYGIPKGSGSDSTTLAQRKTNVSAISDDEAAADSLERMLDGTGATLALSQLNVIAVDGNKTAIVATGDGSGAGMDITGGATGSGLSLIAGATSTGADASLLIGDDNPGSSAHGVIIQDGGTGSPDAVLITGENDGMEIIGIGGVDINADISGTITTATNVTNQVTADITAVSGDPNAADTLEAWLDGYANSQLTNRERQDSLLAAASDEAKGHTGDSAADITWNHADRYIKNASHGSLLLNRSFEDDSVFGTTPPRNWTLGAGTHTNNETDEATGDGKWAYRLSLETATDTSIVWQQIGDVEPGAYSVSAVIGGTSAATKQIFITNFTPSIASPALLDSAQHAFSSRRRVQFLFIQPPSPVNPIYFGFKGGGASGTASIDDARFTPIGWDSAANQGTGGSVDLTDVWRNQDTVNVDSSDLGVWLVNNLSGSSPLVSGGFTVALGTVDTLGTDTLVSFVDIDIFTIANTYLGRVKTNSGGYAALQIDSGRYLVRTALAFDQLHHWPLHDGGFDTVHFFADGDTIPSALDVAATDSAITGFDFNPGTPGVANTCVVTLHVGDIDGLTGKNLHGIKVTFTLPGEHFDTCSSPVQVITPTSQTPTTNTDGIVNAALRFSECVDSTKYTMTIAHPNYTDKVFDIFVPSQANYTITAADLR